MRKTEKKMKNKLDLKASRNIQTEQSRNSIQVGSIIINYTNNQHEIEGQASGFSLSSIILVLSAEAWVNLKMLKKKSVISFSIQCSRLD